MLSTENICKIKSSNSVKCTQCFENTEEIQTLKDQIHSLKIKNKQLKIVNLEMEKLLNYDCIIQRLETSVKLNCQEITKNSYQNSLSRDSTFSEFLSNLNKNFEEYLEILRDVKKLSNTSNKTSCLIHYEKEDPSLNENVKRNFIRTVYKNSFKPIMTRQGIISKFITNKFSNDNSCSISNKSRDLLTDYEIKEEVGSNNLILSKKSRFQNGLKDKIEFPNKVESIGSLKDIYLSDKNTSFNNFNSKRNHPLENFATNVIVKLIIEKTNVFFYEK